MKNDNRPSVYLLNKANSLLTALDFFETSRLTTIEEKRLIFLSQIDFWDWELENLIFSFQNFSERSDVWEDADAILKSIQRLGLPVKNNLVRNMNWSRKWYQWYRKQSLPQVTAPFEVLQKVINKWNKLLDCCEKKLLRKDAENDIKFGANIVPNLDKYRKSLDEGADNN